MKNKKSQDPTEAALSAIEDALNIGREAPEVASPVAEPRTEVQRRPEPRAKEDVFAQRARRTRERLPRAAANDDRQSVGQILQALHRKPSSVPVVGALLASIAWIIGGAIVASTQYRTAEGTVMRLSEIAAQPGFMLTLAAIFLPPLLFFLTALQIRRAQEMRHISRAMTEVTLRLAEPEGVSTDAIVSVGQAIRREVAALGDGIERAVARASELEAMVRNEVATLEGAYGDSESRVRALIGDLHGEREAIVDHAAQVRDAIATAHEAFAFDVQNVADRVSSALDNATGRITDDIMLRAEQARDQLTDAGNSIIESLSDKSNEATRVLSDAGGVVLENLTVKSAEATRVLTEVGVQIAQAIADRNEKVSEALQRSTDDINAKLNDRLSGISTMIEQSGQNFENTIGGQLKTFTETVLVRGNEIASKISAEASTLGTRMAESVQNFDTTVKVYGTNIVTEIKGTIDGIANTSRDSLSAMDERIAAKTKEVSEQIDQRVTRIETTLDERLKSLNEALAGRTLEFAKTITEGSKNATEAVDKSVAEMGEHFSRRTVEMATTLADRAEKIDETLGNRAAQLTDTLDTRVNKFEELVVGRLETITSTIERKGIEATDLMVERVASVNDLIRGTAGEVEKNLTHLAENISSQFIERVNNITGAHETLRAEVRDIIAELGQTHHLLQAAIDTASSTLGPIENKVADKVTTFHHTLESAINATRTTADKMDRQIRELNESSNGVLRDVSNLTLRFEEQVRLVATTTESLSETHRRIDQGMDQRQKMIADMTNNLAGRTDDLEERLTRFNKLLHETFESAQGKSTEIARMVAESTATATQSIARQYDLIRNSSTEERDRTNIALKDTYEEAMKSVNAMFSETNARFLEASRDLREISDDIQRSLESTREEIRRTVFELPTETKESANAMRRVVADQIRALTELNDIVARHGREHAPAIEYREEELAVAGNSRSSSSRGLPRPQFDNGGDLPPAPRRPERKPADRSARFDEALNKNARQPDFEDDDGATGIESLDALSVDIVGMIDHDAASEAWERFKRGERGVFNRRLYTTTGQQTFEDIRKKYRRSTNFRETVDRYIDEFEKLLEQVSRDDRGQTLTRTYLTSDTGKVYTLLAHAAGRLG